jgi:hypothetical protein
VGDPSSRAGDGYLESEKMEVEEDIVEKREARREFVVTGGDSEAICGLKSSPIPARRYRTMEPGLEEEDPGLRGIGNELGLRGEGVLIKFVDRERGIEPAGRSMESAEGLCEREDEPT